LNDGAMMIEQHDDEADIHRGEQNIVGDGDEPEF
jgi:hypothetical protein